MTPAEVNRFDGLFHNHLSLSTLQGTSQKTIDAYSRAVHRVSEYFDCCPDRSILEQLQAIDLSSPVHHAAMLLQ